MRELANHQIDPKGHNIPGALRDRQIVFGINKHHLIDVETHIQGHPEPGIHLRGKTQIEVQSCGKIQKISGSVRKESGEVTSELVPLMQSGND